MNKVKDGVVTVYLDDRVYSRDAILKCLYWYGKDYHTEVEIPSEHVFRITVRPKVSATLSALEFDNLLQQLERDFVDFNLRDIVAKETRIVRELLIAKAFSNGEFDELPKGVVSDPVGFDINIPKNDGSSH